MNSRMTTNSQLSTTEPKKQKQTEQTTRTGTESQNGDHLEGYQWGGGGGEWEKRYVQTRQRKVKNRMGNGEAKELICMTHGYELKGRNVSGKGGAGHKGDKGGEIGKTVIA